MKQFGSVMIALSTDNKDLDANTAMIKDSIKSGKALEKFKEMVEAQRWRYKIY